LSMIVVPYVTIKARTTLRRSHPRGEMRKLASKLSDSYKRLYLFDVDGASRNKPQLDIAQEICDEIPTMYEGGVRYSQNVIDVLIAGADKAVIGTATLASLNDLRGAFKLSENITLKVDYRDGIMSFDPAIAGRAFLDLYRETAQIGVSDFVVPMNLAEEAAKAKKEHGFSLGVFATMAEQTGLKGLGVDYIVTEDFRRIDHDE